MAEEEKSLTKVIFSFFWARRKWLAWLTVILLTFASLEFFGASLTKSDFEKPALFQKEEISQILAEASFFAHEQAENKEGLLGGPMILGSLMSSVAQASLVDFSADDELEDLDFFLLQENYLVSSTNPSGTLNFAEFNREVVTYIVKQGDIPERIAASFGINTDTLLWANNLRDGDIIRPGDSLTVLPINGVRIKIANNDTVESLAKKYNGGPMEIIAFNNLSFDGALKAGEYIIIPGGEMPAPPKPKYTVPAKKYAGSTTPASSWLIWSTSGRNWGRIHGQNGVDIANDCGTAIYAAAAGKVIISDGVGWNGGYGKYIKIQHSNGVATLYAHATKLLVGEGEQVGQGQLIALMGTTGRSTGCHLHFEVRGAANPLAKKK